MSIYEARTIEQCYEIGFPDFRQDELRMRDRKKRDEQMMRRSALWGGCIPA